MNLDQRASADWWIKLALRLIGGTALFALIAVVIPEKWFVEASEALEIEYPRLPLTAYLARQLSLWYAFFGCILLIIANDLERYRPILRPLAWSMFGFGAIQFFIDWQAPMPRWWTLIEGPRVMIASLVLRYLVSKSNQPRV